MPRPARVGLPGYQDRNVSNLSAANAAARLAGPPHWPTLRSAALDEPTSALDDAAERAIEELVLSIIHERQMTCVMITHDMPGASNRRPHHVPGGPARWWASKTAKETIQQQ